MKKLVISLFALTLLSCTDNNRAKNFGGTEIVNLEPNEIFINSTWKDSNLWIITHDTVNDVYFMREKSSFGVLEGVIVINPNKLNEIKLKNNGIK